MRSWQDELEEGDDERTTGYVIDTGGHWWSDFRKATRVRDRITHPRLPKDLDISPDEVMLITKVEFGFRELMGSFFSTQSQSE
jgi:hypothetical protein